VTATLLEQAPVQVGEILDGKYRVDGVIGAGGMGVVVVATHVQLNTRVALKFLLPEALRDAKVVERFVREARSAVQIQSEHVARVIDVATLPNGAPYMVMEYLEGQDLADTLAQGGPLGVAQAVGYVLQACEAVAEAHTLGIVHRDLKPANLFLTRRPRREPMVKVLDFGISKSNDPASLSLTKTASMMGSPYYMSPEQMKSARDVDLRSDIWALGVILFELLSGTTPFQGDTITELVVSVTQGRVPSIRDLRPDVPEGLEAVIARCLERDPARRYPDVGELAKALVSFGPPRSDVTLERIARLLGSWTSGRPAAGDIDGPARPGDPANAQPTAVNWANSQTSARRALTIPVIVGVAGIAAGVAAVVFWRGGTTRPAAAVGTAAPSMPVSVTAPAAVSALASSAVSAEPIATASSLGSATSPPAVSPSVALPPSAVPVRAPSGRSVAKGAGAKTPAAPVTPEPALPANRGLNMGMKE
jgi:eukaryotic-like serine/threonine-protein kinase